MAITYEPIATNTLGSAAASITFSSIPATYTDLRLILNFTLSTSLAGPRIQFNSDTTLNYSYTNLKGDGTTATSNQTANNYLLLNGTLPSTTVPSFMTCDVFSYAGSTFKTALSTANQDFDGSGSTQSQVGLWRSTSAITSLTISVAGAALYAIGTTATIYGIKAA
jgi:hypothetical protein